ncbi:MAG: hypothetical protein FWF42_02700 [Streptococcaceae bacterium]|nr:hypothetical protein [Streptococcaceae bacterium]MCL2858578.1 hypothetical protein [Streptococcaceae bacterium]
MRLKINVAGAILSWVNAGFTLLSFLVLIMNEADWLAIVVVLLTVGTLIAGLVVTIIATVQSSQSKEDITLEGHITGLVAYGISLLLPMLTWWLTPFLLGLAGYIIFMKSEIKVKH